jgi:hypothetical protein
VCGMSNLSATIDTHKDYGVFLIRRCAYLHTKQLLEKVRGDHDMNMVLDYFGVSEHDGGLKNSI